MHYLIGLTLFFSVFSTAVQAEENSYVLKDDKLKQVTSSIEAYLNNLGSFESRFEQINPDGSVSNGYFLMKKPGKVLWHYTKPDPLRLISDGGLIYFEDMTTKQVTQVPREGLAKLLTAPKIQLDSNPFSVREGMHINGFYHLRLHQAAGDDIPESEIILTFVDAPLQLRQVVTQNQFGDEVSVTFFQISENSDVADRLFRFTPPQYQEN